MVIDLESAREEVMRSTELTLVGKILAEKSSNRHAVLGVSASIWSEKEVINVKELGMNLYTITFADRENKDRIFEGGSWSVMGYCLNLQQLKVDKSVDGINFSIVRYWIQIHNLAIELMTAQNGAKIGS